MSEHDSKLLIIDDSPDDHIIFRRYLMRSTDVTYEISEAEDGEEGLQLCQATRFDCILVDYNLPDMNGMELLTRLQEHVREQESAIIMLTGVGDEQLAVAAMKYGVQDYLVKDKITPEELRLAVSNAIEKVRLKQQVQQQQQALAHQYEIFSMLAENAPDAIIRMDRDFRYIYVNPAMQQITGYPPMAFSGKTNQEMSMPQDYTQTWDEALKDIFANGQAKTIEYIFQTPQGIRYFQTRLVPEVDAHGALVSVLGMTRDVSEHREEVQRKDTFISLVSHELRSPLSAMKGNIQLAMRRLQSLAQVETRETILQKGEEAYRLLQRAIYQVGIESRLINDLLDVSRIQANKLIMQTAPYNLTTVVSTIVEEQRTATPRRTIELSILEENLVAQMDRGRIEQVVNNYLTNALRYSAATSPIQVGVTKEGQQARVWVQDHGVGLSEEAKQHIWERFYQVKDTPNSSAGLGLGLYICQVLIDLHGGSVGVESKQGSGSTFWFRLPLLN